MDLKGKVVLMTGGAQGLGKAYCEILLKNGAKVCIADINASTGEATAKELTEKFGRGRVMFVKCDVTSEEAFENAFRHTKSEFGPIDVVCNNAGILDERKWRKTVEVNLTATIQGTLLGIEYLRKDKGGNGGVILNIASTSALRPVDFLPAYASTKVGVLWFTMSWAENPTNEKTGIRFCSLCPSFSDTDMLHTEGEKSVSEERFNDRLRLRGVLSTEDVAEAFLELLQKEDNNGAFMIVTRQEGRKYIPVPSLV